MRPTVLVFVALALVLPAGAGATTSVSGEERCRAAVDRYDPGGCYAVVRATGDGAPSEVTATREGLTIVVRDAFGVTAGPRCAAVADSGDTAARCTFTLTGPSLTVDGGAGDDRLLLDFGSVDGGPGDDVVQGNGDLDGSEGDDLVEGGRDLDGGPGADTLRGGVLEDRLDGGPGPDTIDGGEGLDSVDYGSRTAPLTVDLETGAAGQAGEGDRLSGTETVLGGAGDDDLRGSDAGDLLYGGAGDDELRGAGGDDSLLDREGTNLLDGGPGDDDLATGRAVGRNPSSGVSPIASASSRSTLLGGDGTDYLRSGVGSDRLDPGAGSDEASAYGGRDTVWSRERDDDVVRCGRYAAARVGSRDLTQGCRRVERTGTPRPRIVGAGARPERGWVDLGCSDDHPDECQALLRVYALGRELDRERFGVRPGDTGEQRVTFGERFRDAVDERGEVGVVYRIDTFDARGRGLVLRAGRRVCEGGC